LGGTLGGVAMRLELVQHANLSKIGKVRA